MKKILSILLIALSFASANAQSKLSALTQITWATNTDLMYVVSNAATKGSYSISLSNLLDTLKGFNNWPIGGGGGGNVQTNASQFGAAGAVLTLRDGVTVTNANLSGTTSLTNPPGATPALRLWQTNGLAYTEFTVPSQWIPTNRLVFAITNATAGHVMKILSASISGGIATIFLTNDVPPAAGSSKDIQFNESGNLAGTNRLTYDRSAERMELVTGAAQVGFRLFDTFISRSLNFQAGGGIFATNSNGLVLGSASTPGASLAYVQVEPTAGSLNPGAHILQDLGAITTRWRSNLVVTADATNLVIWKGAYFPYLTASRMAVFDSGNLLTNSQFTTNQLVMTNDVWLLTRGSNGVAVDTKSPFLTQVQTNSSGSTMIFSVNYTNQNGTNWAATSTNLVVFTNDNWLLVRGSNGVALRSDTPFMTAITTNSSGSVMTFGVGVTNQNATNWAQYPTNMVLSVVQANGLTTNGNQFDGVPLSIKTGVTMTNVFLTGTTSNQNAFVSTGTTRFIGTVSAIDIGTLFDLSGLSQTFYIRGLGTAVIFTNGTFTSWNQNIFGGTTVHTNRPGDGSPVIRLANTNGLSYTDITIDDALRATNRIVLSLGSNTVSAGNVFKVHSTSIAAGVNTIVMTNDIDNTSAGGTTVSTNASQFGAAGSTLTLRDGVTVTNANLVGTTSFTNPPGASAALRIWNTNGLNYTELTTLDTILATNRIIFSVTNPVVGQTLKITAVNIAGGVASIIITNDTVTGSGGGGSFNTSQFSATTVTNIKDGFVVTNGTHYGTNITIRADASSDTGLNVFGNNNGFFQLNVQNSSSGASASSDLVMTADNGSATTHYGDFGINGSGGGVAPFATANHGYIYMIDDILNIGSLGSGANGQIIFHTTGNTTPVERGRIDNSGVFNWRSSILASNYFVTNQIVMQPENFNGSNTTVLGRALTNQLDYTKAIHKAITNDVGTNLTFEITTVVQGTETKQVFRGLSGTTNTLSWTVVSGGTNIKWLNWSTNGSNDIIIKGGFTYQVDTFVDRQTNITAKVWSDDPFVPFRGLLIQGGNSISNAWAGGTVFVDTTSYTNLNAASQFTNMGSITIPAHMLTNSGDALRAEWSGNILAGTNRFMIGYGSITNMFDSGSMTNKALNNYIIRASITRNGNTSERVYGEMSWNGGNGLPFTYTNFNKTILETNGIDNLLALKAFSNRLGGITNNYFRVFYEAVPR